MHTIYGLWNAVYAYSFSFITGCSGLIYPDFTTGVCVCLLYHISIL